MAKDNVGRQIFLLAQSYIPAQDLHILTSSFTISSWYDIHFGENLETPERVFKQKDLK